ncbi:MAG: THUMP domain-containing protein, partial [Proteobacteria bacterium]|nr:THUMP domain-containing protein [Pseudomonadota bacterium]
MIFNLIAICPEETKDVLVQELRDLGVKDIDPQFKAVHFKANEQQFYSAHLRLRTASRLMKVIKIFSAKDERMLFDQARRIPWGEVFSVNQTFMIEGVPGDRGEGVMTANTISKRIREAIQGWFLQKVEDNPKVDLEDPNVYFAAFVRGGKCILSVDTSGKSMHKRGYRSDKHPAPIKETLAASILKLLKFDGSTVLYDP